MANYTSTANVVLSVNGKQAQKMLSSLEKDAKRLEKQIAAAANAGDKATMKKLQRELRSTQRMMEQLKGASVAVDNTLRRLDKATPKELNKALRTLQQQLNGIERGSAAWDAQVAKIKAVKEELNKVNEEMRQQRSLSDRFADWLNKWQMAIVGVGAAITGLVMAGRKAVNAYAEMEQEMANVRKYTGMSAEEVGVLNEEFKKIDTRTPREELNQLAQEAGRLGKSSQEDVLGFVRAADKINVALNDLGSGATLTLSKLTGIFGDEKRLGTEKALLSVGSVVNELSQNCAASAPYIAEFASRMGGVGAQANMTVQQIMGFAAVLDSNNQKLEASSTALSQVIVRIYQDPAKYARVAGMDVQRFADLVKTDMNAALIEFLSTLKQAGNMDVLSPMFKDMGENGSRAISALSTLANHIDEVKAQQLVANQAFEEATSIDKEFNVQNNTVQAGLDKAKNCVHELAVELGEKLQPVMRLVISSSTIALKTLSVLVDFFIKYRREILSFAAAIAAYTLYVKASTIATAAWSATCKIAQGVAATSRVAILALRIVYYQLTGQITRATAATRIFNTVSKASPIGLIIGIVTALIGVLASYIMRTNEAKRAIEQARKEEEEWKKSLTDISDAAAQSAAAEERRVKSLYETAINEAKSKDERRKAAEKLQQLYPDYFKNLSTEQIMVGQAKVEYDNLRESIINAARARAAAAKIQENETQLLSLEDTLKTQQATQQQRQREYNTAVANKQQAEREHRPAVNSAALGDSREMRSNATQQHVQALNRAANAVRTADANLQAANSAVSATQRKIDAINAANTTLAEKYEIAAGSTSEESEEPVIPTIFTPDTELSGGKADKFAKEKEWREQEEAMARISYATGETDYIAHTKRMNDIAVEFYERQLLHTDLSETERLQITAQWREAQKKQQELFDQETIDAEDKRHSDRLAELNQFYLDGSISKETYDSRREEEEILHQFKLTQLTKEGSRERLAAEQQYDNLRIQQMQRRQQETERLEQKYASMKKEFFGDNPQEKQAKYDADLAMLQVVYDREIAAAGNNAAEKLRIEEAFEKAKLALKKQYGLLAEEDTRNAMEKGVANSLEWLNSDGGKAVTGTLNTLVSGMSAVFSQLSSYMQAELEIQTAAINKRYDAEISRAEGNSYKVKKLEKQKEAELAKAKNEANRKMFAMQVIQAVAQTATNALSAYGSAAAIPVVGYILAPIAAAMAVAAGAIQIATIKKQQQASEAQGYSEGGFTPPGGKDEAVGVVHAGEWVASQKLVNNPKTRPLLEALEYAQRTNTIGSLTASDVSRSITAPMVFASQPTQQVVNNTNNYVSSPSENSELTSTIRELKERLSEPFVTVNTVSGDLGIQKAQDEYEKLMRNKSPKSRK